MSVGTLMTLIGVLTLGGGQDVKKPAGVAGPAGAEKRAAAAGSPQPPRAQLAPGVHVKFPSESEASLMLYRRDDFVDALSPFDRSARLATDEEVDVSRFVKFVSEQVIGWKPVEIQKLYRSIAGVREKLAPFEVSFPKEIIFIKTTGKEEGQAAYCRKNAVVIPAHYLTRPAKSLEKLLLHELFHIHSSHQPAEARDRLYSILGFRACGDIGVPRWLDRRRITNPDAPRIRHRLVVTVDGESTSVVPFLYSSKAKYDKSLGGRFFRYLVFRLMVVEQKGGRWVSKLVDGKPILLAPEKVPDFGKQIGENTRYTIHPEEVLADNFVLLVSGAEKVRTPRIIDELRRVFRRQEPQSPGISETKPQEAKPR